ncbi:MAG: hypothetical protein DRQ51_02830 [Gammaproteobacteria bacterium]|nr:MAG: hypothetical protein DRQ51_02830 [Gammaproteobacteria bacterium]
MIDLSYNSPLAKIIKSEIRDNGVLSFADFMQKALYHPQYGYYTTKKNIFGVGGDFITAPLVSSLFSYTIACQFINTGFDCMMEIGGGDGTLSADLLLYLQRKNKLPAKYYICEISPDLQQTQQQLLKQKLPDYFANIQWVDDIPDNFSGFIIANEVLDAMAVEIFKTTDEGLKQIFVDIHYHKFIMIEKDAGFELKNNFNKIQQNLSHAIPYNYQSEICLKLDLYIKNLFQKINTAVVVCIDYGYPAAEYYRADRKKGTILANYQHKVLDNVLKYAGLCDLSCFVDFTAVADIAINSGFDLEGFINQGDFLINNNILKIAENTQNKQNSKQRTQTAQQLKELIMPSQMGERFKVMAWSKNYNGSLQGFAENDQTYRL